MIGQARYSQAMNSRRLVKVALPAKLVEALDEEIERSDAYDDRSSLIADAIASLLAELELSDDDRPTHWRSKRSEAISDRSSPVRRRSADRSAPMRTDTVAYLAGPSLVGAAGETIRASMEPSRSRAALPTNPAVHAPPDGVFVGSRLNPVSAEPTWGMHNRDWPTLWAATSLGLASVRGPVDYLPWLAGLTDAAWRLADQLDGPDWDPSGLPANLTKPQRSEGRFRTFFVGDAPGVGPLFSLQLAAPSDEPGTALLTDRGRDLLQRLEGLEPRRGRIRPDWRNAFLGHLAAFVPADFEFLDEVVGHIEAGKTTRMDLLQAVAANHSSWKDTVVKTNVAGFIARGREWNLVEPSQKERKYSVVSDAREALEAARQSNHDREAP